MGSYFTKEVVCVECGTKYVPLVYEDKLKGENLNLCSVSCMIKNNNKNNVDIINGHRS